MPEKDKGLSRDDLLLFMEWYKSTAASNTTLLDQQKSLIEKQKAILDKQSEVLSKISLINVSLDDMSTSLNNNTDALNKFNNEYGQQLIKSDSDSSLEHSRLSNKIYGSYVVLGSIIIGLISLYVTLDSKLELLELLKPIAIKMGVPL